MSTAPTSRLAPTSLATNTFNAQAVSMEDYGMAGLVREINVAAARLARQAADEASTPDRPRLVAGAIGPMNRTLSLSPDVNDPGMRGVTFDGVRDAYAEQIAALVDGGVDLLLVETVFDTLNCKAAIAAIRRFKRETGSEIPVMISGTIVDLSGRTLVGQTVEAFWNSVMHCPDLVAVGFNCSLGGAQLRPYIEELSRLAPIPVSFYPNAGLPNALGGYDEQPGRDGGHHPQRSPRAPPARARARSTSSAAAAARRPSTSPPSPRPSTGVAPRAIPDVPSATRVAGLEALSITDESAVRQHRRADERDGLEGLRAPGPRRATTRRRSPSRSSRSRTAPR